MRQNLFIVPAHSRTQGEIRLAEDFPDVTFTTVTTEEFARELRLYVRRFRRYDQVVFFTYDFDVSRTVLWHAIVWWLSRKGMLLDGTGRKRRTSLARLLILDAVQVAIEGFMTPYVFSKVMSHLSFLSEQKHNVLSKDLSIAYLRTDHWFGIKSGGSVTHIAGVANAFRDLGIPLFFLSSDRLELIDEARTPVMCVTPSPHIKNTPDLPQIAYNLRLIRQGNVIFARRRPALVYQRYSQYNYAGAYLAKMWQIPFVLEYNGSEIWVSRHWGLPMRFQRWAEEIELATLKGAEAIVVVSDPLKQELMERGIQANKILVNPNGVDIQRFDPDVVKERSNKIRQKLGLTNKIVVGFIGTFGKWHGAEVLATAVQFVINEDRNVHFLFIGDGSTMPAVRQIIQATAMSAAVTFTGMVPQEDGPFYLGACDILASPHVPNSDGSPFFGSPTKLFEYMAMGKGIVASRLNQIAEVLRHNETAILVRPGADDELAIAILHLARNPEFSKQLGRNARCVVARRHTWHAHVERIIDHLNNIWTGELF